MANLYCDYTADDIVRRFVILNFGSYPKVVYWNNVLDKIPHLDFLLANKADLIRALSELSRFELKIVYPIQVSALNGPTFYLDYEHEHSYDVFGLIVGDTFQEQLFSWNKVFYCRTDNQTHRLNHLWLPMAFAKDTEFMEALGRWLRRMTEYVHLFSFSVGQDELSAIGESLDGKSESKFVLRPALYKSATALTSFPFPKFPQGHSFSFWDRFSHGLSPPKEADHYRASSLNEEFEIRGPSTDQELRPRGSWIADVFISANKNRFYAEKIYSRQDTSFWWQLPRKRYLAAEIFGVPARINAQGIPSIQLHAKNPKLRFKLPDERMLLATCVRGDTDEFKRVQNVDWRFNEDSVKDSLSRMLDLGVIQMGFAQKCYRCGSKNWFLVDEVRQTLTCVGCRYDFSIPAEPPISYRLNSLVRRGIFAHGLVPVVLVLGQMLEDARSSFFFCRPSISQPLMAKKEIWISSVFRTDILLLAK